MTEELTQEPKSRPEGDIAMQFLLDESNIPLANKRDTVRFIISEIQEIARTAYTSGTRSIDQNTFLTRFKDVARQLVRDFGKNEGDILQILPPYREEMADVVANALNAHFIGYIRSYKNGPGGIFSPAGESINEDNATYEARRKYIQEFTSLVSEILILTQSFAKSSDRTKSGKELNGRVGILAQYRSTEFVQSLFNGSLLRRVLDTNKIHWNDQKIRSVFTPGVILNLVYTNRKYIETTFVRIAQAYDRLTMKDENGRPTELLKILNQSLTTNDTKWQSEEAKNLFTHHAIRHILTRNIESIEKAIVDIGEYYRTNLSTISILSALNSDPSARQWTKSEVGSVFTHNIRQFLAVYYRDDCVRAAKRFAQGEISVSFYKVTHNRKLVSSESTNH